MRNRALALAVLVCAPFAVVAAGPPDAAAVVAWDSKVISGPTHLPPGGEADIRVLLANAGDTGASDFPTVSFELPPGVTASATVPPGTFGWSCVGSTAIVCTNSLGPAFGVPAHTKPASGPGSLALPLDLIVDVAAVAPEGTYPFDVTLSGGGGPVATETHRLIVSSEPVRFGIVPGSLEMDAFDSGGAEYVEAGGHPHRVTARFELNTRYVPVDPGDGATYFGAIRTEGGGLKDTVVDLPAGLVANPNAGPRCPSLAAVRNRNCPDASQVGVTTFETIASFGRAAAAGIYNVRAPDDSPGQLAFMSPLGQVVLEPVLRGDEDYGLSVRVRNLTEADDVLAMTFTLWGVAARSSHDPRRCSMPNEVAGACVGYDEVGSPEGVPGSMQPHTSSAPAVPFLTMPTACDGQPMQARIHVDGWSSPGGLEADGDPDLRDPRWASAGAEAPPLTRCDRLRLVPSSVIVQPTAQEAHSPSGLRFELTIPQNDDPDGFATAHLDDVTVSLPEGLALNAATTDGLDGCPPQAVGLLSPPGRDPVFDRSTPACPLSSKIGTARVRTPLLADPLDGGIYLAQQGANPFGSLLALYVVVEGAGTVIKLAGRLQADPASGRLTISFLNNPRLPFDSFELDFKSGPRAPLVTPGCGTHTTEVGWTSWAAPGVEESTVDSFRITRGAAGRPCSRAATGLRFGAGSLSPVAGESSPFVVNLSRDEDAPAVAGLELGLPRGLSAKLAGIPYCPEAALEAVRGRSGLSELAAPSCAASQVGAATIAVGAGPYPNYLEAGKVYLAGPNAGAPISLAIVLGAVAGPFDLGTVVVRAGLDVDPRTARISVRAAPIPTILQGIPLQIRDIRLLLDRPGFTRNPTSCRPMAVNGTVVGAGGSAFAVSAPFQVRACRDLPFEPALKLALRGKTQRSGHPALRVALRMPAGSSNLRRAAVTLPDTQLLDNRHLGGICSRESYAAASCPPESVYGYARAWSPLFDRPLRGPVYLRSSDNDLPDLVAALGGQVKIDLVGRIDTARGRIRNTFAQIPDAPIEKFVLNMKGGRKGLLANNTDLCRARPRSSVELTSHSGEVRKRAPLLKVMCKRR